MLQDDVTISAKDIQALKGGRDAISHLFARLGYDTSSPLTFKADVLDSLNAETKKAVTEIRRIAQDDFLEVYSFELKSLTLAHRQAIVNAFSNTAKEYVFILTAPKPECERIDFVLLQNGKRPLAITILPAKHGEKERRLLSRFTYTCTDGSAQCDKLASVFTYADWGQEDFNNVALFSDYFLKTRLHEIESDWNDASAVKKAFMALRAKGDHNKANNVRDVKGVVHDVLTLFGQTWTEEAAPDGRTMLRLGERVVCLPYAWARPLDTKDDKATGQEAEDVPASRVVAIFEQRNADWVILTNGSHWRLYCAKAHARHANFFEISFREALAVKELQGGDAFRYFWLLFRAKAFKAEVEPEGEEESAPKCLLDRILEGSREYSVELGESLKERVFNEVFPHFAEGFVAHLRASNKHITDEQLADVYHGTLTLLYRLIFLLYAESRNLLPVAHQDYRDISLRQLCEDISPSSSPENAADAAKRIVNQSLTNSVSSTALYERLLTLFEVIDQGSRKHGVPRYNGGLFQTDVPAGDEGIEARAARFIRSHRIGDRHLAMGLDKLVRIEEGRTHFLHNIDYKTLGVRQLGSIYEGLLEFKVRVANERMAIVRAKGKGAKSELIVAAKEAEEEGFKVVERSKMHGSEAGYLRKGTVFLENDKHERKASGSYYTPDYIVKYIVRETVGSALKDKFDKLRNEFDRASIAYRQAQKKDVELDRKGLPRDGAAKVFTDTYGWLTEEFFKLRVLDPAMGSGHFLVEAVDFITDQMLNFLNGFGANPIQFKLAQTRSDILKAMKGEGIDVDESRLSDINLLKRHVLKRCIFGVDLNPMAVELSKVSLWLDCFTIGAPLSFLDHHLKCGNSLIGVTVAEVDNSLVKNDLFRSEFARVKLVAEVQRKVAGMPDATAEQAAASQKQFKQGQAELEPFKHALNIYTSQWFGNDAAANPHAKKKSGTSAAASWLNSELLAELLKARSGGGGASVGWREALKSKSTKVEKWLAAVPDIAEAANREHRFFHWDLEFPDVFYEESESGRRSSSGKAVGFDALIGNPPYLGVRTGSIVDGVKSYFVTRYVSAARNWDLYSLFLERGVHEPINTANLGVIVPTRVATNHDMIEVRKLLLERKATLQVLDAGAPFEDPSVLASVICSTIGGDSEMLAVGAISSGGSSVRLRTTFNQLSLIPDLPILTTMTAADLDLFLGLTRASKRLGEVAKVTRGMECGKNDAAVIEQRTSSSVPVISGEGVSESGIQRQGMFIELGLDPKSKYKDPSLFTLVPKALVRFVAPHPISCVDNEGVAFFNTVYSVVPMTPDISPYQVAVLLNSKLVRWWFTKAYNSNETLFPHIQKYQLDSIPVPLSGALQTHLPALLCKQFSNGEVSSELIERRVSQAYGIQESMNGGSLCK